jgi:RNA-directed DNA polymerase
VAYGGRVCEAGMLVSSSHGDPGRPSALRVTDTKAGVPAGGGRYPSGAMAAVGRGGSRGRRGQGVGCGHSSDDDPGNRGGAKGHWSVEGGAEKTCGYPPEGTYRNDGCPTRPLRKNTEGGGKEPGQAERRRGAVSTKPPRWEGQKLHSLMPFLYRKKTMVAAWENVRKNKGAPGVDGESIEDFGRQAKERLWELSEALRTKSWHPKPLRRVWIPKPDGTKRGLAVPCVEDRVVHAAVAEVLYAVFEDEFGPDCYAYVKGRNALDAVDRVYREASAGKRWMVETDIRKFFDTIPRRRLLDKLAVRIADGSFLRLVSAIVRSGVLGEDIEDGAAGVPQGSPLSPLLANIYLAEFDRRVGRRHVLARYADDLVVLCATEDEAIWAYEEVEAALKDEGLSMKPEKTRVTRFDHGVDFLGYHLSSRGLEPSERSVKRYQEKVRTLTMRYETRPLEEIVQRIMPVVRGWTNYFHLTTRTQKIWHLGGWTIDRLRCYEVKHRWYGAWARLVPIEMLHEMGFQLPYNILTGGPSLDRESRMR